MSLVVKIGGALLSDPANAVQALQKAMDEPAVVVHGGGVQITKMLDRMHVPSRFVHGLRVTGADAIGPVCYALLGEVHARLVQAMLSASLPATGVFGGIRARKAEGPWGLVGAGAAVDAETLSALLSAGRISVVPALAVGTETLLNVNGDDTAAAVAVQIRAARLVFMTDVAGVKDAEGNVIERVGDVDRLLRAPFVSGGMLPKLRAVRSALTGGVRLVMVGHTRFEGAS